MSQMTLDFAASHPLISDDPGKKTERITITCSGEYKDFVDLFCRVRGATVSEICHRYILEGMRADLATLFMAQPHLDKSLRDILEKKF